MENAFKIQAINKALYEARVKKNVSLKEAAKNLGIFHFRLSLIEKGYLHVPKRLKTRFINYYQLNEDFFKTNTTYVDPINVKYEDPHLDEKIRARAKKKKTKIISGVISLVMIGLLATGIYYYNRFDANPRAPWSDEYVTFREQLINHEFTYQEPSVYYPGDINYVHNVRTKDCSCSINMPSQDTHSSGLYMLVTYRQINVNVSLYNHKKILDIEVVPGKALEYPHCFALCTYAERGTYDLPKVSIEGEGGFKDYYPESQEYKDFYNLLFGAEGYDSWIDDIIDYHLKERGFSCNYDQILDNVQKISEYEVFGFRLGFRLILFPTILLVLSLSVLAYALFKSRKIKEKKIKTRPYVVHKTEYTADAQLVYRSVPNDTKFPMIIPEFALRVLALIALLLSSIGIVWLTNNVLTGGGDPGETASFNSYVSNLFVTGITLAFFLKLDVYHKKSNRELIENITILFTFGLVFYVAECVTYACLSSQGTIYSELIKLLSTLLPGNIIWNLMLYSLIFFFLFTLPKRLEDAPHKILLWRLASVIPTLLLIVAFIYQGTFKGAMSPYVSFLFHTNGLLSTAFAIFYLYSLFFFQQYVSLKYGKDFTKVFLDSRRYALQKNMIACIVLVILSLVDLLFFFYLPFNGLNLGSNWIIATLIPFILLYRPHIGKRDPKWDIAYNAMYVLFLTGGFLISFNMIANTLDLSQVAQIIN